MEEFFEQMKCPIGRMITIWGERLGLEEWAIREAAEEYFESLAPGGPAPDPINVSWDVLHRAEAKRPISQGETNKKSDPGLRTEINRLRGVIANLREAISDLAADKEEMWAQVEVVKSKAVQAENDVKELRKDNLAFSEDLDGFVGDYLGKFDCVYDDIENLRLAAELDKLESESKYLKAEVKGKRRSWWKKHE